MSGRVSETCQGVTVELTEEGAKAFISEITSTAMALVKAVIYFGGKNLSKNMIMGIASMRCVLTNGFDSSWTLVLAAYYFGLQFGQEALVVNYLNEAYPHICTCTEDSATI